MDTTPEKKLESDQFVARWQRADGTELANYQLFIHELAALLGVEHPQPSRDDTRDNAYVFERRVTLARGDGSSSEGRIDCYRRGAFVLEAKKIRVGAQAKGFDDAMLRARTQAENYARALPADEGRPPFLLVVDVGNVIELYSEFTRSGATYIPFPDPRSHRIRLADLARPEVRERLAAVWTDPLSLDPTRQSARVTREIAAQLAEIAKALEGAGHAPQTVASFLSRCLFTMFAEDVGLLPKRSFADLLARYRDKPDVLAHQLEILWANMDRGEFSPLLEATLLQFNGKLFKDRRALPLDSTQIDLLFAAARADWKQVEPAIFGTLLERALDPEERHALGAHYTPRAYVERLVLPTIIEPIREDWSHAQVAALVLVGEGKAEEARKTVRAFLHALCEVRVLDPACGSGNFLYVSLEQMKRLEGEVLNFLDELGDTQGRLDLAGVSVDPHQLLGLEINPRAAEVAEMVLWIGYLQWHFRTRGNVNPPLPVLKDFHNIECRDAVLAYDRVEHETDGLGRPVTRWDGRTMKRHPVTGLDVPDERAQLPVEKYVNPRAAKWPMADYIIGNPPYLGARVIRDALGQGYLAAVRSAYPSVPENADYVMYWWDRAADLAREGQIRRFGLITTNSLRQSFSQKVLSRHVEHEAPLSILYAVPDHPWVDSATGAAVRVALTVGSGGRTPGDLDEVVEERTTIDGEVEVTIKSRRGPITSGMVIGVDVTTASPLDSNAGVSCVGYQLTGKGFVLSAEERSVVIQDCPAAAQLIRPLLTGRDLTQERRDFYAIDAFRQSPMSLRTTYPAIFQRLVDRVKPERDVNARKALRDRWWIFGEARSTFRPALAGLDWCAVTSLTAKHRTFVEVPADSICDSTTVMFALQDRGRLGVLSSRVHVLWSLNAGGRLGVGNDPRYNKSRCFETFPFPVCSDTQAARIATLAEQIDAHRKRQQAQHPNLKLTGMYNVLEELRAGEVLTPNERTIHDHGLVSVLRELHDDLDHAVFDAYGWNDLAAELVGRPGATTPLPDKSAAQAQAEEELLARLVKLNAERAAEEARGLVRWLRPEYQAKQIPAAQTEIVEEEAPAAVKPATKRIPWPATLPAQIRLVADIVTLATRPLDLDQLADHFTGRGPWKKRLPEIVDSLTALGRIKIERHGDRLLLHS